MACSLTLPIQSELVITLKTVKALGLLQGEGRSGPPTASIPNPLSPRHLSASERLAEIAEILAAGLMRLRARQSSPLSPECGESSLDCPGNQSGRGRKPRYRVGGQ